MRCEWLGVALMTAAVRASTPSPTPVAAKPASDFEEAKPITGGAGVRPDSVRLLAAARRGELDVVTRLVEAGEAVNPPAGWRTPLIAAALHDHVAVMEYLLAKGAQVNARDLQGRSALWASVWANQPNAFKLLLAKGADVNVASKTGDTLLFMAVERGTLDLARELIAKGAVVDRPSQNPLMKGFTPLHRAAMLRNAAMAGLLLDHGADPQAKNEKGQTPADLATGPEADEIRKLLQSKKR